jgi:hypothetical protein
MVDQRQEAQRVQDVKIEQKINAAHREAFHQKFPGQIDHILRLIAERLQAGLRKDQEMPLSNCEVESLAQALYNVYCVHTELKHD